MERWYHACHKAGKDNVFKAQMTLERINVMAFSPIMRTYRPRADRPGQNRQVIEQLFPGYIFICFDPEIHHSSKIETSPGISHLVRFAGEIAPTEAISRNDSAFDAYNLPGTPSLIADDGRYIPLTSLKSDDALEAFLNTPHPQ